MSCVAQEYNLADATPDGRSRCHAPCDTTLERLAMSSIHRKLASGVDGLSWNQLHVAGFIIAAACRETLSASSVASTVLA